MSTLLFIFISTIFLNAQSLTVENSMTDYDEKTYPAVTVTMNPSPDKVKEEFEDYMKDNYDVKMKGTGLFSNRDVLYADRVDIEKISDKTLDFRAKIIERGDITELSVFGSFGYDLPISRERFPEEYRQLKRITVDFINEFLPDYYKDRVDETEEMLEDLVKDREKLKDDITDNEEEIEKLRKENEENRKEMEELETKISDAESKLNLRQKSLRKINSDLIDNGE